MFAIATLLTLVNSVSGTPYISGGDSPAGTDCSGLVSWVTNAATGRPVYGDRFNTGNIESALRARGFQYGTQPGALVVGWNRGHTAATLPDGTPVSSGENGGVKCRRRWCLPKAIHPSHVSSCAARAADGARCACRADGRAGAADGAAASAGRSVRATAAAPAYGSAGPAAAASPCRPVRAAASAAGRPVRAAAAGAVSHAAGAACLTATAGAAELASLA